MTIGVQAVQSLQRMKHKIQIQKDGSRELTADVLVVASPRQATRPHGGCRRKRRAADGGGEWRVESGDWTLEASAPLRAAGNPRVPGSGGRWGGPWTDGAAVAPVPVPLADEEEVSGPGAIDRSWAVAGPVSVSDWACCTSGRATFGQVSRQRAPSGITNSDRRVRRRNGSA